MSGLATKKFAGRPAASAFVRNDPPRKPFDSVAAVHPVPGPATVGTVLHMKPHGFGFIIARKPWNVVLVQPVPVYLVVSPACDPGPPLRYARKMGSGDVPGAPVYANVAPRPA